MKRHSPAWIAALAGSTSPTSRLRAPTTCRWPKTSALALGLGIALAADAAAQPIRFDALSVEEGLSQSHVNFILQDSVGFMWFGTEDGLNRYDGSQLSVYKSDPTDPTTLPSDFVWAAQEDASGDLWLALDAGGVARWDRDSDGFVRFQHDPDDPESLASNVARSLLLDSRGRLWVGTGDAGLDLLDPATGSATHHRHDPNDPASLSHDSVFALYEDRTGGVWVGTAGGLNRLDPASGRFERYQHDPGDPASLSEDQVRSIYQDRSADLWIGTRGGGLNRMAGDEGFVRYDHDPDDPGSLSHGFVRAVLEDADGRLWIGTAGGLDLYDREREAFSHYQDVPSDPHSLSDSNVWSLHQDRGGVLWVGTQFGGVNKWDPTTWSFGHYNSMASGLSGDNVHALAEDTGGALWIGTLDGGLTHLDRETGAVRHYRHDPDDPGSLSDDRVTAIVHDRDGGLWVGTMASGLNYRPPGSDRFTVFRHDTSVEGTLSTDQIICLFEDARGTLWIGTFGGGLNRFDHATGRFSAYRHDPSVPDSLSEDRVTTVVEDGSGSLWIGTYRGGLNRLDRDSDRFVAYRHDPRDPTSLGSDTVYGIHVDSDGTLYVATPQGLNRLSTLTDQGAVFERFSEREGLANDVVYGVLPDAASRLWLSTNGGLSRFDPDTGEVANYDVSQGLQGNEFNFGAFYRTSANELLFGGPGGFNAFFPEKLRFNTRAPAVVLTAFLKFNKPVPTEGPAHRIETIDLGYLDDVVTFEFAALDFAAPSRNRYEYQLVGFDADWIDLSNLHRVTYTDLAPGSYLLRVRASNNDGVWNEQGLAIPISVEPPPWRTWWAQALYVLALAGLALAVTRAQRRKARSAAEYRRRLESEVKARTQELQERNVQLEDLNQKLSDASLTDSLTGLRNRRFLFEEVGREINVIQRDFARGKGDTAERLLFIMIDLDGFKPINDTHGHAAGDQVLLEVRRLLEQACRTSDVLIRWGGDEFLVVARQADLESAETLPERIRAAVADHSFELEEGTARLTASIGVALFPMENTDPSSMKLDHIVALADRALYVAKKSGRDAWVCFMGAGRAESPSGLSAAQLGDLFEEGALDVRSSLPPGTDLVFG